MAKGLTGAVLPLSKAIEREVESMKMPPLVVCLTTIGFFALSPASRGAPPGGGGSHNSGGGFHGGGFHGGGFHGRSANRRFSMGGHSATIAHFSRASGFAGGLGSQDVSLPAGRGNGIAVRRHDDGRFRDHDFRRHGDFRDSDRRHHRHFFSDFDFVAFGFPDWWYPDYGYVDDGNSGQDAYDDSAPAYGDQYWQDLAMKVQSALSRRGYCHGPIDGVISPDGIRAIRAFQEAQWLPATGRIDPNVLRALQLPNPQVALRSN